MPSLFDEETPRWVRATILGAIAAVLAVIGLVVALVVVISGDDEPGIVGGDPSAPPTSTAESSSICGLPDGDQTIPSEAPDATWTYVGPLAMPSSPEYGPGEVMAEDRSCFARSPLGAVFKVLNTGMSSATEDPYGIQWAAFRVVTYSATEAQTEVVGRATRGSKAGVMVAVLSRLTWRDGDWVIADDDTGPTHLSSLNGFIEFAAGAE